MNKVQTAARFVVGACTEVGLIGQRLHHGCNGVRHTHGPPQRQAAELFEFRQMLAQHRRRDTNHDRHRRIPGVKRVRHPGVAEHEVAFRQAISTLTQNARLALCGHRS